MNKRDCDILLELTVGRFVKQRDLANACGYSLGAANASIKRLIAGEYIDDALRLTEKSRSLLMACRPERAVLLSAERGVSVPPYSAECPTALLKADGETLIERIIRHLHEAGITEIHIVVGFAKERFEYLIDRYGVNLIVNAEYNRQSNSHSLSLAQEYLNNAYVVSCDVWFRENPFRQNELSSWYMVSDVNDDRSFVRVNRKQELAVVPSSAAGNAMMGLCYLCGDEAERLADRIRVSDELHGRSFNSWEELLVDGDKLLLFPRMISFRDAMKITSYEDMLELENPMSLLTFEPTSEIARLLNVPADSIEDIALLKKGTTNYSYHFSCGGIRYILRLPRDGSGELINHRHEAGVYRALSGQNLSEETVCFEEATGLKISRFIEKTRPCDPQNENDVAACMQKLRQFHERHLTVGHAFDLFELIDFYESLWNAPSVYADYEETKRNVLSLRSFIESQEKEWSLTHIDAVPDNFLIPVNSADWNDIRLIDWEFAAMQDPHADVAMFCLYAMYDRAGIDRTIDLYFGGSCPRETRLKIYCYIAVGGLIWSNWCEYKYKLGTYFGAYSLKQYRYAKDYYRIVQNELNK